MPEYEYKVLSDGSVLADNMALDMACSFAQFLFEKWYAEPVLKVTIERCNECIKGIAKEAQ